MGSQAELLLELGSVEEVDLLKEIVLDLLRNVVVDQQVVLIVFQGIAVCVHSGVLNEVVRQGLRFRRGIVLA